MTPDQLITFATVAEHGNISRAAVALHLSQPAVSGQLRQLQDESLMPGPYSSEIILPKARVIMPAAQIIYFRQTDMQLFTAAFQSIAL